MISERLKKWARLNKCKIDENGLLHVYKAVHKVKSYDGVHYIANYGIYARNNIIMADPIYRFGNVIEYEIGKEISINDDKMNTDCRRECAPGLHASGLSYANRFGRNWGDGCVLELTIDLKDPSTQVVVPYDSTFMKMYGAMVYLGEYKFKAKIEHTLADKIRTNKITPVREVQMCETFGYTPEFHCERMDWRFVLEILEIKKRISDRKDILKKAKKRDDLDLLRIADLENEIEFLNNKLKLFEGKMYDNPWVW